MSDLPTTAKEAREEGVKYFFTDKPCKHGHVTLRYASNGTCVECHSERKRVESSGTWYAANKNDDKTYEGITCRTCGNTTRYTKSRMCCHCATHKMTPHEVRLLIVRNPNKSLTWYRNKSNRKDSAIYDAYRALNIPRGNKPQHYVG